MEGGGSREEGMDQGEGERMGVWGERWGSMERGGLRGM